MSKCVYDLSADCHGHDCLSCVLDKIRAEIAEEAKCTMNNNRAGGLYKALQIIDKYKAEGNE